MQTIIAIDPGSSGGIAVYSLGKTYCEPMPETEGDLLATFYGVKIHCDAEGTKPIAFLESQIGVMGPGMRVSSSAMFTFGRGYGFTIGVLMALGIPIELVRPQKWQSALSLGSKSSAGGKTAWKNKLKAEAQRCFPELKVTLKTADALLLLRYALREGQK